MASVTLPLVVSNSPAVTQNWGNSVSTRALLKLDTRDDRREVAQLLRRLSPSRRVAFLQWCCARAPLNPNYPAIRPQVQRKTLELAEAARWDSGADERLAIESVLDWWNLVNQYHLDVDAALRRLEAMGRRG